MIKQREPFVGLPSIVSGVHECETGVDFVLAAVPT